MPSPDLGSRRRIYQIIHDHPGLHFRELLARCRLAQGTLQYHLPRMAQDGLIAVSNDGGFTRYYATGRLRLEDRPIIDALRREYGRRILATLVAEGALPTHALAQRLGRTSSTVSWHLARLSEAGLVLRRREGQEVLYEIADAARVIHLYTLYRASFTDRLVDSLLGLWDSY